MIKLLPTQIELIHKGTERHARTRPMIERLFRDIKKYNQQCAAEFHRIMIEASNPTNHKD